jgi:hypothetical protein
MCDAPDLTLNEDWDLQRLPKVKQTPCDHTVLATAVTRAHMPHHQELSRHSVIDQSPRNLST